MKFTEQQLGFIHELIDKELFFAESSEPTPLTTLLHDLVDAEKNKLELNYIGSEEENAANIIVARTLINKLKPRKGATLE